MKSKQQERESIGLLRMDGEEVEFRDGFTELHAKSDEGILKGEVRTGGCEPSI